MNKLCMIVLLVSFSRASRIKRLAEGKITNKTDYPFFAQLTLPDISRTVIACSGSLIHPLWVLTAADCFPQSDDEIERIENLYLDNIYTVCMGSTKFNDYSAELNSIKKIHIHRDFKKYKLQYSLTVKNNVAVLLLTKAYTLTASVSVIPLPVTNHLLDSRCSVGEVISVGPASWQYKTRSKYVRSVTVLVTDGVYVVKKLSNTTFYWKTNPKEPYTVEGDMGSDSGAPFVCYSGQNAVQYGLVAGTVNTTVGTIVTIFEDVTSYSEFITDLVPL